MCAAVLCSGAVHACSNSAWLCQEDGMGLRRCLLDRAINENVISLVGAIGDSRRVGTAGLLVAGESVVSSD